MTPSQVLAKILANSGLAGDYYNTEFAGETLDAGWTDAAKLAAIQSGLLGPEIQQYWNNAISGGLDGIPITYGDDVVQTGMNVNSQEGRWLSGVLAAPNRNAALRSIGQYNADPHARRAGEISALDKYGPAITAAIISAGMATGAGAGMGAAAGGSGVGAGGTAAAAGGAEALTAAELAAYEGGAHLGGSTVTASGAAPAAGAAATAASTAAGGAATKTIGDRLMDAAPGAALSAGASLAAGSLLSTPEGDGGALDAQAAEEERKTNLRSRISRLYGIGDDPEAMSARERMAAEEASLGDATRGYYTDELGRKFTKGERNLRFNLARAGQLGGSQEIDQMGELKEERNMGATRVDQAVRESIHKLTSGREQERLNALQLVNAGSGEDAVVSASRGVQNALSAANSGQRADIFSDLFSTGADVATLSQMRSPEAALLAQYRNKLSSYFPSSGRTSSGRVTPSA